MDEQYKTCSKTRFELSINELANLTKPNDLVLDAGGNYEIKQMIGNLCQYQHTKHFLDFRTDKLPYPDNHFDGVLCWEVLEHLWIIDDGGLLLWDGIVHFWKECYRILKPSGFFFLTTPNRFCPRVLRTFFLNMQPKIYSSLVTNESLNKSHIEEFSGSELLSLSNKTSCFQTNSIKSIDCYGHMYDIDYNGEEFRRWKSYFRLILGRELANYEAHDTLFFTAWK